jgi:cytochrome b subunit of formate dehydrogenase
VAIQRFRRYHRVTHAFVIVSFFGLAFTGAPLKYAETGWAQFIFSLLGGVSTAGWLHRMFAVMTFGYFGAHVFFLLRTLWRNRERGIAKLILGPESPVPNLTDLKDVVAHIRYFLGRGPKPTWDRWTYWEKFDYWAVFWGVAVIGLSGLVLWFPEVMARVLPGWAVNIAFLIHSDEALLAMGFIFAIHFFNGHLRHDKFPLDPVIFTGAISEHEFKEERGREYQRLVEAGKLDELRTTMPPPAAMRSARVVGIAAWLFGTLLLALIIYAQFLA